VHYGVAVAIARGFDVMDVVASRVGFVAGGVWSYALNRRVTFATGVAHRRAAPRFAILAGALWLLNGAGLALLERAGVGRSRHRSARRRQ